jgi:hypothetical protein
MKIIITAYMNMKILLLKYTVLYNLYREVAVTATNTRQELANPTVCVSAEGHFFHVFV